MLKMNFGFVIPRWVEVQLDAGLLDGATMKGGGGFEVIERWGIIGVAAAIGMDSHVGTKLVAKMGDAVEGGNVKVDTLIVEFAHRVDIDFIATDKDYRQRTNQEKQPVKRYHIEKGDFLNHPQRLVGEC